MHRLGLGLLVAVFGSAGCSGLDASAPREGDGGRGGSAMVGSGGSTAGSANSAGTSAGGTPASGGTGTTGGSGGDGGAHVTTWVPPYRVDEAKQQLSATFGGRKMADGLSFLALQFWITDGPSTYLDTVTEGDISWFHDWARQNGVKILLCVHNHVGGDWNWPEALRSFQQNREAFVAHLLDEVAARDLDGVDLDLEGIVDATPEQAEAYKLMAQGLADGLHPLGKVVTVDSFHGQWNAPNWNWWPDLLPIVDGVTSMGYEQSGMGVDYETLVEHAAVAPDKLMIGVPSYQGAWLGHSVSEQLGWLVDQGQVGVAIWDAALLASEWQQASVWEQLSTIKAR